jgi:lysosomal alpha-mannosidase
MMIGNIYWQPHGFDFQGSYEGDGPFIDNPNSTEFNADAKAELFVSMASEAANHFRTNHIMYSMGGDFQFINAHEQFKNIEKMIAYVNARYPNVTLLYSTPGQYIDSLYNANISWPTRYDDMFPYADKPEDYWTGYFSSRAAAKWQVREGQAFQHASNWLYSLKALDINATDQQINDIIAAKDAMLDAMGIYQHHDAITGTAKQYVADDYTHRLFLAKQANMD